MTTSPDNSPQYDLAAIANKVHRDAQPIVLPLTAFAVVSLIELTIRVGSGNLWSSAGMIWDVLPLVLCGTWLALRITENHRGIRSGSTAWGIAGAISIVSIIPVAIVSANGGGPVLAGLIVLVIAALARNTFLTKSGAAMAAAGIAALLLAPLASHLAGDSGAQSCEPAAPSETSSEVPAPHMAYEMPTSEGATTLVTFCENSDLSPHSPAALPGVLIVPITFAGVAVLAWRRDRLAKA